MLYEVITGTADLALEAFKQLNPEKIIGVDISVEMLCSLAMSSVHLRPASVFGRSSLLSSARNNFV